MLPSRVIISFTESVTPPKTLLISFRKSDSVGALGAFAELDNDQKPGKISPPLVAAKMDGILSFCTFPPASAFRLRLFPIFLEKFNSRLKLVSLKDEFCLVY